MKAVKNSKAPGGEARYAARLLFQFRVMVDGDPGVRRLCEERIIVLRAPDARSALSKAKGRGKAAQHHYKNSFGNPVYFELIGITDLLELGVDCEPDEVWYSMTQRVKPMERRGTLIPKPERLNAIALERSGKLATSKRDPKRIEKRHA